MSAKKTAPKAAPAMKPVKSSNIEAIGYDPAAKELTIQFKGSGTYKYLDVPAHRYGSLMAAGSHGEYFQKHIKHGFQFERIADHETVKQ